MDFRNSICLYYCGKQISLNALCLSSSEEQGHLQAIASNPVACARFFNLIIELFIKIILHPGSSMPGLFGCTSSYYETVESQNRLTLHLYLLLWIEGFYSPLYIWEKIMENDAEFCEKLVEWLKNTHQGEFCTGMMDDLASQVSQKKPNLSPSHEAHICPSCEFEDPTLCLSACVPSFTSDEDMELYWDQVCKITDEIMYHSNWHNSSHSRGCLKDKDQQCCARFPR